MFGFFVPPLTFGLGPLFGALLCTLLPETANAELPETLEEGENFGKYVCDPFVIVLKQVADSLEENTKLPAIRKTTGRNVHIKQTMRPETLDVLQMAFSSPPLQ